MHSLWKQEEEHHRMKMMMHVDVMMIHADDGRWWWFKKENIEGKKKKEEEEKEENVIMIQYGEIWIWNRTSLLSIIRGLIQTGRLSIINTVSATLFFTMSTNKIPSALRYYLVRRGVQIVYFLFSIFSWWSNYKYHSLK